MTFYERWVALQGCPEKAAQAVCDTMVRVDSIEVPETEDRVVVATVGRLASDEAVLCPEVRLKHLDWMSRRVA